MNFLLIPAVAALRTSAFFSSSSWRWTEYASRGFLNTPARWGRIASCMRKGQQLLLSRNDHQRDFFFEKRYIMALSLGLQEQPDIARQQPPLVLFKKAR
jgi:hypothetical protein